MFSLLRISALLFLFTPFLQAQDYYRIGGDFTVLAKGDSLGSLTRGKFFFDKNQNRVIYEISFPYKEIWVFADTSIARYRGDSLLDVQGGGSIVEFSIFNLALNNHLSHYGLKNSKYQLNEVERVDDMVISTWGPPPIYSKVLGDVVLSTRSKRLQGIVFFNVEGDILRKQFFKDYEALGTLSFPREVLDLFYSEEGLTTQKTLYKNLKTNEEVHEPNLAHLGLGRRP